MFRSRSGDCPKDGSFQFALHAPFGRIRSPHSPVSPLRGSTGICGLPTLPDSPPGWATLSSRLAALELRKAECDAALGTSGSTYARQELRRFASFGRLLKRVSDLDQSRLAPSPAKERDADR